MQFMPACIHNVFASTRESNSSHAHDMRIQTIPCNYLLATKSSTNDLKTNTTNHPMYHKAQCMYHAFRVLLGGR